MINRGRGQNFNLFFATHALTIYNTPLKGFVKLEHEMAELMQQTVADFQPHGIQI